MIPLDERYVQAGTYVPTLASLYEHGDVLFRGYSASDHAVWDSCLKPHDLLRHILSSLPEVLPELKAPSSPTVPPASMLTPGELAERLASLVTSGGCYHAFTGGTPNARRIAQSFAQGILGPSRHSAQIYSIDSVWTPWFSSVIHAAFVIVLPIQRQWFLLCATDED